jgi:hypothetical protein
MHRITTLTIALAALSLPLVACGGDDVGRSGGDTATVDEIRQAFIDQGAPEDEATCVAEMIEGQVTLDDVQSFADAENPEDIDAEVLGAIGLAVGECVG